MMKRKQKMVNFDQIVTSESDIRFLLYNRILDENNAQFTEIFYDLGRIFLKKRKLEFKEKERINSNLTTGISEGRVYYAHDLMLDRDCYFGYIIDKPNQRYEILCKTVIYEKKYIAIQERVLKDIDSIEQIGKDAYIIKCHNKMYIVKYLRVKTITLGIAHTDSIPEIGKEFGFTKLELETDRPIEFEVTTSKLLKVIEKDNVYVCDTLNTRYILLKERENDVFGICSYEPCIGQKLICNGMEFMAMRPYFTRLITGIVIKVKRLGNVYVVTTTNRTYYMLARFRIA